MRCRWRAVVKSFEAGLGRTLGHIAIVVGLGTMLGKMMAESGGADQIALTLIRFFGEKNIHWAMMVIGLVVGLPVFFEVGFRAADSDCVYGGAADREVDCADRAADGGRDVGGAWAGASASGGVDGGEIFNAEHWADGSLCAADRYSYGGDCRAAVCDVDLRRACIFRRTIRWRTQFTESDPNRPLPGFRLTLITILMPVLLMLIGGWADTFAAPGSG